MGQGMIAQGIVLAGTHHWGDCVLEEHAPRALAPVAQTPLVCHVLEWMRRGGVESATVCANGASRRVRQVLNDGREFGLKLGYFEDTLPRGPAGCARDAALGSGVSTHVVADASVFPHVNLCELLAAHRASGAALTMVINRAADAPSVGGPTPTGVYVFDRRALNYVPATGYQDIKESLIPMLYKAGEAVATFAAEKVGRRVTGLGSYLALNQWYLEFGDGALLSRPGYRWLGPVQTHWTAEVHATARVLGPCLIGPGASIGPDATVIGPTVMGTGCRVDSGAVLCRSVLWSRCVVGAKALIDHCVLTDEASVGAGASIYNQLLSARGSRRASPTDRALRPVRSEPAAHQPPATGHLAPVGMELARGTNA